MMSNIKNHRVLSTIKNHPVTHQVRHRAGMTTAAVCAAAVVAGGGMATAAAQADLFGSGDSGQLAEHALTQAETQQKTADAEAKKVEAKKAAEAKANGWVTPITDGYTLSATYGNDGNRWASGHSGQDFAVPNGTPVKSVHKGTVVKAGGNGGGDGPAYGNAVVVQHGNGTFSQYAHLDNVQVQVGDEVKTGEQIGLSGNTGNSTGPHLHFEIRTTADFGSAVDPASFLRDKGVSL